jgi:Mo-dependent nitrogenase C-terminus
MSFQQLDREPEFRKTRYTAGWVLPCPPPVPEASNPQPRKFDVLRPLRNWLDQIEVKDPQIAHRLCQTIPSQCPFERDVQLFGKTLFHIPPLCKLNPLYEETVSLRFRAMCYLADDCGEDVSRYC